MDLSEALVAILLFSVAGIIAAQWQGRRRRSTEAIGAESVLAPAFGFILGGVAGAIVGLLIGEVVAALTGQSATSPDGSDEIAQYFVGPGLIIGAFAGGYVGRAIGRRITIRRQSREER